MLAHELTPRDGQVVRLVGRLNQASSWHIKELLFRDVSRISMDRSLSRLVAGGYLSKVGRRAPGPKGGNAPVVYQLGRKGWWHENKAGRYWGRRAMSEHSLLVADLFTALVLLDKDGNIKLLALEPEYTAGHARADLYVDAGIPAIGRRRMYYLEVQRSARPDVIRKKLDAYGLSFRDSSAEVWPYLAFVLVDSYHRSEIAKQVPQNMREWVRCYLPDQFLTALVEP